MTILKIIETLQAYDEAFVAYKTDGNFAHAVTEAIGLLIRQGEQIADLQNELRDERYRHDRYVDFELAEAEELRKLKQRWIPVTERLPEHGSLVLCFLQCRATRILQFDEVSGWWLGFGRGDDWRFDNITHWMPLPDAPKGE